MSTQLTELSHELLDIIPDHRRPHVHHLRADLFIDQSVIARLSSDAYQDKKNNKNNDKNKSNKNIINHSNNNVDNIDNNKSNNKNKNPTTTTTTKHTMDLIINPLQAALIEKEAEALQLGDICLIKILILLSDQLCKLSQFHTAVPYLKRAIFIHKMNIGHNQVELGTYYSMLGQTTASIKGYQDAIRHFKDSIKIFEIAILSTSSSSRSVVQKELTLAQQLLQYCQDKLL
jgi:hypothetical protein